MKHKFLRRLGSVATAVALVAGLTLTSAGSAQAGAPDDQSTRWLHKQLTDGLVHNDQFDFDDYGLTVDFGFALIAISGSEKSARDIRKALAKNIEGYVTGVDFAAPDDIYAGPTAKALVFARVSGAKPRDFGGVDLVKQLNRRVSKDKPIVGRIEDKSASGDFANVIGQAYAAQGLAVARSPKADEALKFLLKQQCDKGWFRLNFAKKTKNKQSCDAGKRKTTSAPDTDATALAVLSLLALPKHTKAVTDAIDDAVRWLKRRQEKNGSFGGGRSTEAPNSNSTGLAASALGGAGACRAANHAARWVGKLQLYGSQAHTPTSGERGAIAYDKAALKAAEESGIGDAERDQWRRATAQAAPALLFLVVDGCD